MEQDNIAPVDELTAQERRYILGAVDMLNLSRNANIAIMDFLDLFPEWTNHPRRAPDRPRPIHGRQSNENDTKHAT